MIKKKGEKEMSSPLGPQASQLAVFPFFPFFFPTPVDYNSMAGSGGASNDIPRNPAESCGKGSKYGPSRIVGSPKGPKAGKNTKDCTKMGESSSSPPHQLPIGDFPR